ncbi:MAG: protease pro-enzyme activation domain-containing protein, partial [Limisphaerales bacterium]
MTKKCELSKDDGLSSRRGGSLCGFIAVVAATVLVSPGMMAQRQVMRGHIPSITARLQPIGEVPETNRMNLVIGLPLRNQAMLKNLLGQIYDPASTNFHHYLTPAQFAAQFGPSPEDYQAVMNFATSHGLRVTGTHPNRTLVDLNGAVADIEKTLHLRLRTFPHPTETRTFFAPDSEPSVDLAVPLLAISGLNNYILPHPLIKSATKRNPLQPRSGSGSGGTYLGSDFRAAYVPGTSLTGAGQSIGLWEGDGYVASDIASYEGEAGLPNVPLVNVYIAGATGQAGSGASEVSLDIEMAISMAPGVASVIVYEGPDEDNITVPNEILNRMATDDLAKQLSCSWGFSIDSATDQIFQQYAAQGQSFFLAAGDSGAFVNPGNPVEAPSDDPYITIVGATTLNTGGPGGTWQSETVWNWYTTGEGKGASSGGISATYSIPSWQAPVRMANNQGSTTMRNLPDVAMAGDNVWVIYGGGQSAAFGGTSCAAPLWAGLAALVNEQGSNNLRAPVGFINPAIYSIGLSANYASTFHDITTGNNTNNFTHSMYFAVSGYDLCTGWGT